MNKLTIFGAGGMLGYAVEEYFGRHGYNVNPIYRSDFDIGTDSHDRLRDLLRNTDVVINCAGVIKPRIAANSTEEVIRINSVFPNNLAKVCNEANILCFHITTDCVYSGKKGNYDELALVDAEDLYGLSKSGGDSADCMVLRTSIIGEEKGNNRSLLEWVRSQAGNEVNGFTNHSWNGVTTLYLAECIEYIVNNNLYRKGIFHIYSPKAVNKYELLQILDKVYELRLNIKPIEANNFCDRSLFSNQVMSSIVCRKTIEEQVFEMKEFFETVSVDIPNQELQMI